MFDGLFLASSPSCKLYYAKRKGCQPSKVLLSRYYAKCNINSMGIRNAFAVNLKKYRVIKGLTKQDLAQALNVHWNTVNRWEKGELFPKADMLEKVAEILGVTVNDLLSPPEPEPFPGYNRVMAAGKHNQWDVLVDVARENTGAPFVFFDTDLKEQFDKGEISIEEAYERLVKQFQAVMKAIERHDR